MKTITGVDQLASYEGKDLGVSDWLTVDQKMIDLFAEATGDHQWIHVDPDRAAREFPGGKTIAHGYLTLSLIPRMAAGIYRLEHDGPIFNYGLNKVRYTDVVPSGSRLRLHLRIIKVEDTGRATRVTMQNSIEKEGSERPVLIAENLIQIPA